MVSTYLFANQCIFFSFDRLIRGPSFLEVTLVGLNFNREQEKNILVKSFYTGTDIWLDGMFKKITQVQALYKIRPNLN